MEAAAAERDEEMKAVEHKAGTEYKEAKSAASRVADLEQQVREPARLLLPIRRSLFTCACRCLFSAYPASPTPSPTAPGWDRAAAAPWTARPSRGATKQRCTKVRRPAPRRRIA